MNLSTAARKILKAAHIAAAGVILGGVLALLGLRAMKMTERWWPTGAPILDGASVFLFDHVIQIGFYCVLLTAFLMSLYTKWGFFQYWWVVGKWILSVLLLGMAVYLLAPALSGLAAFSDTLEPGNVSGWDGYARFETRELAALSVALVLVALLFLLAVLKPWRMRKGVKPFSAKSLFRVRLIVSAALLIVIVIIVLGNA
ncbi:MAG: hypothetical protein V2A56_01200 [bacterium]